MHLSYDIPLYSLLSYQHVLIKLKSLYWCSFIVVDYCKTVSSLVFCFFFYYLLIHNALCLTFNKLHQYLMFTLQQIK